jgi:hypothetical protein
MQQVSKVIHIFFYEKENLPLERSEFFFFKFTNKTSQRN